MNFSPPPIPETNNFNHNKLARNQKHNKRISGKSSLKLLVIFVVVIGLVIFARKLVSGPSSSIGSTLGQSKKVEIKAANKTQELNKEFVFPIRGNDGEDIGKEIKYTIEKAELTDELVVKGKRASAVKGRTFLVLTIKLGNDEDVSIDINTRNYIRLEMEGSGDRLAADIHSDPVSVQPISTKFTKISFPIDEGISSFTLFVGEIKGEKQEVILDL